MSLSLTDDNVRWINNHPITKNNILDIVNQNINTYHKISELYISFRIKDNIDIFKTELQSNITSNVNKIENNIDKLNNKFDSKFDIINDKIKSVDNIQHMIDNAITNRIISNDEYKHIYEDNLEKLKLSLEQKGNQIMTSLISDSTYQNIINIHLETLSRKLEDKYDDYLIKTNINTNNMIKKLNDMKSELTYYKHKLESIQSQLFNGVFIISFLFFGFTFVKFLSYCNIQSNPEQIIKPVIKHLDTMGTPILRVT